MNEFPREILSAMFEGQTKNELPRHDYSDLPDLSDSILNDDDRIKFRELFRCYRDVFAFTDDQLGKTSLVQHVIDTGDAICLLSKGHIEPVLGVNRKLIVRWIACSKKE